MIPDQTDSILEMVPRLCMSLGINKSFSTKEGQLQISHMPVSLYPYQLSSSVYEQLVRTHQIWQKLFVKVISDKSFIQKTLKNTLKKDPFVKKMFQMYQNTYHEDEVGVSCTRVDYMGDQNPELVEYNLMSIGLNGMSDRVQELSRILKNHLPQFSKNQYPINRNQAVLAEAVQQALISTYKKEGYILLVCHQKQFNYGDQNAFLLEMIKRGYNVLRVTFNDFMLKMRYNEQTRDIFYQNKLVSCFYFRTLYSPSHFSTAEHWNVRQLIQKSKAIKFPSIGMQLINFKRFQAEFAKIQVLKIFLSEQEAKLIHKINGFIMDFDSPFDIDNLLKSLQEQEYVLKPNRQGGGSNFFCKEAYQKLFEVKNDSEELFQYILMKKIKSQSFSNYFIADFQHKWIEKCTSELSTFGSFTYKGSKIIYNECGGSLVRLKKAELNEGGIAINQAVIAGLSLKE